MKAFDFVAARVESLKSEPLSENNKKQKHKKKQISSAAFYTLCETRLVYTYMILSDLS